MSDATQYMKVLWVDDDVAMAQSLSNKAALEGIYLVHYPSWEEAEPMLEKEFDSWDAIILDAHCRAKRDEALTGNSATRFLMHVLHRLPDIFAKHGGKKIPWYIFSAGIVDQTDLGLNELLEGSMDRPPEWDSDFEGTYYSKGSDTEKLFKSIKGLREKSLETKLTSEMFPEVFKAIDRINSRGLRTEMLTVLKPLATSIEIDDCNHRFVNVRCVIESIFTDMINRGLLSKKLITKGVTNISWCSLVLLGDPKKFPEGLESLHLTPANCPLLGRAPKIMADNIKNMYQTAGDSAHTNSKHAPGKRSADLNDYFLDRPETDYLLRSFAYQLCDFILWYNTVI